MSDATPAQNQKREEFLTARQLAHILQVSESTVRRLAQQGRIPAIRIAPRIIRFNLQAVCEALDGSSTARRKRARHNAATEAQGETPQLSFKDLL
jgi:excisionase family DNA binding protein